eukprot:4957253-Amphidinium_carterae.1
MCKGIVDENKKCKQGAQCQDGNNYSQDLHRHLCQFGSDNRAQAEAYKVDCCHREKRLSLVAARALEKATTQPAR